MAKIVVVTSDRIGSANEELGRVLMRNFLYSLARAGVQPKIVFLMNDGVKLACEGSDSADDLFLLAEDGVPVLSCGTCLEFLGLSEKLKVGAVGKMPDLVAQMMDTDDVVTIG